MVASVNNMLKAITASLLMEQVAPNFKFKTKVPDDDKQEPGVIKIRGLKTSNSKSEDIIENDLSDLKAAILQDKRCKAMPAM